MAPPGVAVTETEAPQSGVDVTPWVAVKEMVPESEVEPVEVGVTLAVNLMGWLTDVVVLSEVRTVVVPEEPIISVNAGEFPDWKLLSELV